MREDREYGLSKLGLVKPIDLRHRACAVAQTSDGCLSPPWQTPLRDYHEGRKFFFRISGKNLSEHPSGLRGSVEVLDVACVEDIRL